MSALLTVFMIGFVAMAVIATTVGLVVALVPIEKRRQDKIRCIVVGGVVVVATLIGVWWIFTQPTLGQNLAAEACGGCGEGQRTVTVYAADGDIIAQYAGDIEIQRSDSGVISFVFEGDRYTYYNCSVECVSAPKE